MTATPIATEFAPLLSHWGIKAFELKAIPGGLSGAKIWCVSHGGHKFCLRCWPSNYPAHDQLRSIHRVLQHVWQAGFAFVPVPHRTLQGGTFVASDGHLWELTNWLAGAPLSSRDSTPQQRTASVEALAEFHQAAATFGRIERNLAPGLLQRRDVLAELLEGRFKELWEVVRDMPPSPISETLLQLLSRIEHALPGAFATVESCANIALPLQWCLRDVHPGNVLVQDNQVTGVVDFGAVARDSVAGDIARLVGGLQCNPTERQECLRTYARLRPLTDGEQRAIYAYHVGGLILSAANWIRWLCIEHSVPLANTTQVRLQELHRQFARIEDWKMLHS